MYLDKFKNYLEAEKKYSILTVNAYTKDLDEFKDYIESTGISFSKNIWVISFSRSNDLIPANERIIASYKPSLSFLNRVSTFPLINLHEISLFNLLI